MLRGVDVICFAACYVLGLLFETVRLFCLKNTKTLSKLSLGFMGLGAFAHCIFLYHNDLLQNDHFFSGAGGWFSVLAFAVVLTSIYLSLITPETPFFLFMTPLVLVLTGTSILADNYVFSPAVTCRCVRGIHGFTLLLTTLLTFLGSVSGGMYFWQRNRLKRNVANSYVSLPSLEWLSRICRLTANVSVVVLGIGVGSGFYLKLFSGVSSSPDMASVSTPILFLLALLARFPKRRARAVDVCSINALHNLIVLAALVFILIFATFGPNGHWKLTNFSKEKPVLRFVGNYSILDELDNDYEFKSDPSD